MVPVGCLREGSLYGIFSMVPRCTFPLLLPDCGPISQRDHGVYVECLEKDMLDPVSMVTYRYTYALTNHPLCVLNPFGNHLKRVPLKLCRIRLVCPSQTIAIMTSHRE